MLDNARIEVPKMHMIYATSLSHRIGSSYIEHLLKERLLEAVLVEEKSKCYRTSPKGVRFLELYKSLKEITFGLSSQIPLQVDSFVKSSLPAENVQPHVVAISR